MDSNVLDLAREDNVAILTLDRPEKLNALSGELSDDLRAALAEAGNDDSVLALIVTGSGRGFCSGADLTGGGSRKPDEGSRQSKMLDEYGWVGRQALAVYGLDKPVIAAVNGVAAGAGMSLALACDVRVGSAQSRFKTVFIERNLSPDSGMSFFLPRIVGYSRAADLIYSSRMVDADEAYRIGLLDRMVEHDDLIEESLAFAQQMTRWPPLALRTSKRVLQHNMEVELDDALRFEMASLAYPRRAENDQRESRLAFIEKRKPKYTGT